MSRAVIVFALLGVGCVDTSAFFFAPVEVDGYDFDGTDPELDGDLGDAHPSIIGANERREGFLDVDGVAIHWVLALRPGASDAILYSHGNAVHLGHYWDRVELLWELGYTVLIYDYPGYGRSEGEPTEQGVFAAAQAALELLASEPEVGAARLWLYGYSLGGAPTYELAARSERGSAPAVSGVISEAAFCSIEDLLQDSEQVALPGSLITELVMDNCARMSELASTPVLLLHGTADHVILPRHAQLLERAAVATRVSRTMFDGATHTDVPLSAGYAELVTGFVR